MLEGKKINELPSISTISDETVVPAVYVNNGSANSEASKVSIDQIKAHINEDNYTKNQVDTLLNTKQDKLTAGNNITIEESDENLVISATDTTYTAGEGIEIDSDEISIDDTVLTKTKLVAGSNVTIAEDSDENLVISSTGGGGTSGADTSLSNLTAAGKEVAATMSMPSSVKDELSTSGASGSQYTAPADGYFYIITMPGNSTSLRITTPNLGTGGYVNNTSYGTRFFLPVLKVM